MKIKSEGKRGTRSIVICQNCGEEFSELNIKLRAGKGKFCCNECYNEFRRKNKRDVKESDRLYQKKCKYGLSKEKCFCYFLCTSSQVKVTSKFTMTRLRQRFDSSSPDYIMSLTS